MLKKAPDQADNIAIFQSGLLPKMRLSVVLEGYQSTVDELCSGGIQSKK